MTQSCACPLPLGTRECHCTVCSRHFSTVSAFDKHRVKGECIPPSVVGLVLRDNARGEIWGYPPPENPRFQG